MKRRSLQAIATELHKATRQASDTNQRLLHLVDALGSEVTFRTSLAGLLEQYRQDLEAGKPRYGLRSILDHVESYFIQTAMRQAGHNIALAAERLRVPEATLRYKLTKHDLR
jgi:DNA-binding protein Fis